MRYQNAIQVKNDFSDSKESRFESDFLEITPEAEEGGSDFTNNLVAQEETGSDLAKRMALIAAHTTNFVLFTDRAGCIRWANKVFEKITGYRLAEVIGKKPGSFLQGPATDKRTIAHMRACLKKGLGFKTDILNYSKTGQPYWVEFEAIPLYENGILTGYMSVGTDVSGIKMVVGEMLNAQEILHRVVDAAPLYVSVKDTTGNHIFYNKNFERDFVQRPPERSGLLFGTLSETEKEVLNTGEQLVFEQSVNFGDAKSEFLTVKFPLEDARGSRYAVGRVSVDITERKLVQRALREREELYLSTLKSISDAVILIDKSFRVLYLNTAAEELTGYSLSDDVMYCCHEVLKLKKTDSVDEVVNPLQCPLNQSKGIMTRQLLLISKDKREIPVGEEKLSTMTDSKGEFTGLALFFRDISDKIAREQLEREVGMRRLTDLIEGQERERKRISKELHDNLGQMLNLIKMKIDTGMDGRGGIGKLVEETIQETARIAENLSPAKLRDFDLATALRSLCRQLDTTFNTRILFTAVGDSTRIRENKKINLYRIAQEAINNALKHAHASLITVRLTVTSCITQLAVEDDGNGIMQVSSEKGFHHGLTNMQERAEIMGGNLSIRSEPGSGTKVIVEIPKSVARGKI